MKIGEARSGIAEGDLDGPIADKEGASTSSWSAFVTAC